MHIIPALKFIVENLPAALRTDAIRKIREFLRLVEAALDSVEAEAQQ